MIIVTGGAGFIGSNLIYALNARGNKEIVIVDRLDRSSKFLNLNALDFVDLIDPDDDRLAERCSAAEAIFHLGACTDTTETDGRYMVETNFTFSKRLLHLALERKLPFIYASSAAVYGDGQKGFKEEPAYENSLNVYAASKQMLDRYVRAQLPRAKSPLLGLRYFNVYGPQEGHKGAMASAAFHFYQQLKSDGAMKLFEGSREFVRDFVLVDDAVSVTLELFDLGVSGIFNCGTGRPRSFYDVALTLGELESKREAITFIPFPAHLEGKYQAFTQADLERLRGVGCEHRFSTLEEGIARYHLALMDAGGYLTR